MLFRTLPVASFFVVVFSIASSLATPSPDYYRSQTLSRRGYDNQVWRREVAYPPVDGGASRQFHSSELDSTAAAAPPAAGSTTATAHPDGLDPSTHHLLKAYYHQQEAERHLRKAKAFHLAAMKLAAEGDKAGAERLDMLTLDQIKKAQYDAKRGVHHTHELDAISKTTKAPATNGQAQ